LNERNVKDNFLFRSWYYFRTGWSTYFAFILAAINTLTVTYFLAIENYPSLKLIFPSFEVYVIIIVSVGIPLLILVGYAHFKRTKAFKSEIDVYLESNPYQARNMVNAEMSLKLNLEVVKLLLKLSKDNNIPEKDLEEIKTLEEELKKIVNERTINNKMDVKFMKKSIKQK
tara:strand:- start:1448 stop:1960 length:513 start_codon:yes stop_codon:yes gene_type:complete